jgi:hypothetical protein
MGIIFTFVRRICTSMVFLLAATAHADELGTHWQPVIDRLLAAGIERVGALDLRQFHARALKYEWAPINEAPPSVLTGSRESGVYFDYYDPKLGRRVHKIFINLQSPEVQSHSLPGGELHEALGSLDPEYGLSTALEAISMLPPHSAQQQEALSTYNPAFMRLAARRSGTGVSGGGSFSSAEVKRRVLEYVMAHDAIPKFRQTYVNVGFEPDATEGQREARLRYRYMARSRREIFTVIVPVWYWRQGEGAQQQLVEDIATKLSQLFPEQRGGPLRTFQPSHCGSASQVVTFPATNDESVAYIQDYRGGMLLGCMNSVKEGSLDMLGAETSGSGQDPKDPGTYTFDCKFEYQGQPYTSHPFVVPAGVGTGPGGLYTTPLGLGTDYQGMIIAAPNGDLQAIELQLTHADMKLKKPIPPKVEARRASSTTHGRIDLPQLSLAFECQREH